MNPYKRLMAAFRTDVVDVGTVIDTGDDGVLVQLLTGGTLKVRGTAGVGSHVYIRGGVIEGPAPDLEGVEIEV